MEKEDLINKLESLDLPEIEIKSHKKWLKKLLLFSRKSVKLYPILELFRGLALMLGLHYKKVLIPSLIFVLITSGLLLYYQFPGVSPLTTVQAGESFVPVSMPIKLDFPHPGALAEEIKNHLKIVPETEARVNFDGRILTLEPEKNLQYDTAYQVTIKKGLPLGRGKTLTEDFTTTFSTRPRSTQQPIFLNLDYTVFFGLYTLNYFDHSYNVNLFVAHAGYYNFRVYRSNQNLLLHHFYKDFDDTKENPYLNEIPLDEQTIYLREGFNASYIPKITQPGIYFVTVNATIANYNFKNEFYLVLTKHASTMKRLGDRLVIWVVDQKTSLGVSGAEIKAYGLERETVIFRELTNQQGYINSYVSQEDWDNKPKIIISTRGNDISVIAQHPFRSWLFYSLDDINIIKPIIGFIFTDKPLYQPGDTVNFKLIIRENHYNFYKPVQKEVTIKIEEEIFGASPRVIYQRLFLTEENGTLSGAIELPRKANSGPYRLVVMHNQEQLTASSFKVGFYEKPDFEILISTDKENYIKGEPIKLSFEVRYFSGLPLKNELVKWSLQTIDSFITLNQDWIKLDDSGRGEVIIPTKFINLPIHYDSEFYLGFGSGIGNPLVLEVSHTNKEGRETSKTKVIHFYHAEYSLELTSPKNLYGLESGKTYSFSVRVTDVLDNKPQVGKAINIKLTKYVHQKTREWWYSDLETVKEITVTSDSLGRANFMLTLPSGGSYQLDINTSDAWFNEINRRFSFWVLAENEVAFRQHKKEFADKIIIKQDKESYNIGDKARLTLMLPRPQGDLFISHNSKTFKKISIENISGTFHKMEIPITEELVPGFYLYTSLFQDDTFIRNSHFIKVTGKRLQVDISINQQIVKPGEEIELLLKTHDDRGNPISADAFLLVMDKAIYNLRADLHTDIYDIFYPRPEDYLQTEESSKTILPESFWGDKPFTPKKDLSISDIREVYAGTVYWNPRVTTNEKGEARVKFRLPDNLTNWVVLARFITPDTQVGQGTFEFKTY
ncbi:MAG: hypothetical protein DDT40_00677 [candidate division WS2 bacterium]|nr:hypothetical protein [Candidatus Psychracetigena formicireducens]